MASYNFEQALAKVQAGAGRQLSQGEIDGLFQKFGGDRSSTFSDESLAPVIASLHGTTNYGSLDGTPPDSYASNPNAPTAPTTTPYVPPTWQGGPAPTAAPLAQYRAPTQAELEATPGYATRLAAGQRAVDMSAAAHGTVLNGGTQKATARYGQDYGSNEYNNAVSQGLAITGANNNATQAGNQNAYQTYQANYGQFGDAANRDVAANQLNFGQGQTTYGNQYTQYLDANNRTLSDYITNVTSRRNANNDYWSHLSDVNNTGAGLASGSYRPGVGTT